MMFTKINYVERQAIEKSILKLNKDVTGFEHFLIMFPEYPAALYLNTEACDAMLDAIIETITDEPFIYIGITMVIVGTHEKADAMQIKLTFS